jgi:hypothetical protein
MAERFPAMLPPSEEAVGPNQASDVPELLRLAAEKARELGHSPPTRIRVLRGVSIGVQSRSLRDGYRPAARVHVERYFLVTLLGVSVSELARAERMSRSAAYSSVQQGKRLVIASAIRLGLKPPPRPRDDDD